MKSKVSRSYRIRSEKLKSGLSSSALESTKRQRLKSLQRNAARGRALTRLSRRFFGLGWTLEAETHWICVAVTTGQALGIKPIRAKADYRAALKDIESLMAAKAHTPEGDRLDVLATLIEAYDRAHFPMDLPDAVDAIKFRMEQSGLTVKDLEPVIGPQESRL